MFSFVDAIHKLEGYWTDGGEACRAPAASINAPQCAYALWVLSQPEVKLKTQHELWDYNTERSIFRSAYQDHWQAAGIDVLICPTYPGPAPPFETSRYWGYTSVWNLLDYPSVVLPSSIKVDSTLDQEYQEPFTARNKAEKDFYEACEFLLFSSLYEERVLTSSARFKSTGRGNAYRVAGCGTAVQRRESACGCNFDRSAFEGLGNVLTVPRSATNPQKCKTGK